MKCHHCGKSDEIVTRPDGPYCLDCGRSALGPSDATDCCALVDALSEVLPQHAMACVSRLKLHEKPWSFDVTDSGKPLITRESCQCSGDSMKYLRGLLPVDHPKGFSHNEKLTDSRRTVNYNHQPVQ